jgi:hypothetical protein
VATKTEKADAPPLSAATQLIRLLDAVGEADLAELDATIAGKQAELDALTRTRKLVATRLGLVTAPGKAKGGRRPARPTADGPAVTGGHGSVGHARRVSIARLLGTRGPLTPATLSNELDIPYGSMTYTLTSDWFEKQPDGTYRLTAVGRREAGLPAAKAD